METEKPLGLRRYTAKYIGLGETLFNETGMPPIGVAIKRDGGDSNFVQESVGLFLSKEENQSGTWRIDGGWGGPPGPIVVKWDPDAKVWINGGFCGRRLK